MHLERSGTSFSRESGLGRSSPLRRSSGRWGNDNNVMVMMVTITIDDGDKDLCGNHLADCFARKMTI